MALKLGELFIDIDARTDKLEKGGKQVGRVTDDVKKSFRSLGAVIVAAISVQAVKRTLALADNMLLLEQRVKNVTRSTADFNQAQKTLIQLSNETGTAIADNVKLFEQLSLAASSLGADNEQILQLTESLNKLGIVGGSTEEALKNSLRQFGQSMNAGIVRAEEFNSILENTPLIANAIAEGMGMTAGELRKLVVEGKVLSEDVFNSLISQTDVINEKFETMPLTLARATTVVENNFALIVKEINEGVTATGILARNIDSLSKSILFIPNNVRAALGILTAEFDQFFIKLQASIAVTGLDFEDIFTFTDSGRADLQARRQAIFDIRDDAIAASKAVAEQGIEDEARLRAAKSQLAVTDVGTSRKVAPGDEGQETAKEKRAREAAERRRQREQDQADSFLDKISALNASELELVKLHEEALLQQAQEFREKDLIGELEYQVAKTQIAEDAQRAREDIANANTLALLGATGNLLSGLANLAGAAEGEQSKAYKALFALSKGFAVAQASVSLAINLSKATEVGFPANVPLIAKALSDGATVANILSSAKFGGGRQHGGSVSPALIHPINEGDAPEILNQAGKQFLLPNGKGGMVSPIGAAGSTGTGININVINNTPATVTTTQVSRDEVQIMINDATKRSENSINTSLATARGPTSIALKKGHNVEPRIS